MNIISNPYSVLGQAHNDGLDYVINNLPANPRIEDVIDLLGNYLISLDKSTASQFDLITLKAFLASHFNNLAANNMNNFAVIQQLNKTNGSLNQKQLAVINKLMNPRQNSSALGVRQVVLDTSKSDGLVKFYKDCEYEILTSSFFSIEEKKTPLLAAAIGVHSSIYWTEQIGNSGSPWKSIIQHNPTPPDSWVKADVGGAVGGGITGGLYSWWTGGAVVIGIAAGAIGGAIGSSITAVLLANGGNKGNPGPIRTTVDVINTRAF